MTAYRSWLPAGVLQSDEAARLAADIVGGWTDEWIAASVWKTHDRWAIANITLGDEWTSLRRSGGLSILSNAQSVAMLALAILGCTDQQANAGDLKLMRRLAGEALDDLLSRMQAAGLAAAASLTEESEPDLVIAIGTGQTPLLQLLCSQQALTAAVRKGFTTTPLTNHLWPRQAGLHELEAHVGALLGRASLPLDTLQTLETGDVLILDHMAADPVEMLVAGRPSGMAGTMCERHGQFVLELQDLK